jgi:hypothetical protein
MDNDETQDSLSLQAHKMLTEEVLANPSVDIALRDIFYVAAQFHYFFYFCCLHPVAWAYKMYTILTDYATILLWN